MVYRFTLISNEADDFVREIKIDAEASFYDLHKAILARVDVRICDPGSLPRTFSKSRRVVDLRQ